MSAPAGEERVVSVAIPVYNEERNLPALLAFLVVEPSVGDVIVADDGSTDGSLRIALDYASRYPSVRAVTTGGRTGPLGAWRKAVEVAKNGVTVLLDADTMPVSGAIGILARAMDDPGVAAASGRVEPANDLRTFPAGRFRATAIDRLRALGYARDVVIGRFAAVRTEWFVREVSGSGIIACDAYIGCRADLTAQRVRYVRDAVCRYTEVTSGFDFASQRQRADAGYAQLRAMGVLLPRHEPRMRDYFSILIAAARADPAGAAFWAMEQVKAKFHRAFHPAASGSWEALPATKELV